MEIQVKDFIEFKSSLNEALDNPSSPEVRAQYLAENGLSTSTPYEQSYLSDFVPQVAKTSITNTDSKRETMDEFNNRVLYPELIRRAEEASKVYQDYKGQKESLNIKNIKFNQKERIKQGMEFLTGQGFTRAQASGILGNLQAESSFNTTALGDNGTSYGIAQWHKGRWNNLKNFAKAQGTDQSDYITQLKFLVHELNTSERTALDHLKTTKTVEEAARSFAHKFERMKTYNVQREQYARHFHDS